MTDVRDIIGPEGFDKGVKGRLIYTCNCGWIDLGHANSTGPKKLITDVRAAAASPNGGIVNYTQNPGVPGINMGGNYFVRSGLTPAEQDSAALGIFQRVTHSTEGFQEAGSWFTSSGYSQEDLVSNLIGFHAAAKGTTTEEMIKKHCGKILSKAEAEEVWKQTGAVGDNKNRRWTPVLHKCAACAQACPGDRAFPSEFGSITPARPGQGWSLL